MLMPNATITGYASKTGERGDGLPSLQAVDVLIPIPCRVVEPTSNQLRTAREAQVELSRVVTVSGDALKYLGVTPSVGDRPAVTLLGVVETRYSVVKVISDPTPAMGGSGWAAPVQLWLTPADDGAAIEPAEGGGGGGGGK